MRHLMNHLFWLTMLISGLVSGLGCNALPNPMPLFDLGQKGGVDMAAAVRDAPPTSSADGGLADMGVVPSHDMGTYGDALSDAIADGIDLGDGTGDAVIGDGEVDGTSDAIADGYNDFTSED